MMNGDDFIPLLGLTSDDERVKAFLVTCGIKKPPKLKPGDFTAHVGNEKLGIAIVFRDEEYLDIESEEYEEGSLVLWNITMHAKRFDGKLPHGLKFEFGYKETEAKLGKKPSWKNEDSTRTRWDFKGYCVFCVFEKQSRKMLHVGIQLPVAP